MSQTELLEKNSTQEADSGESNQFAHYAEKNEVTEAYVFGNPILTMCGKFLVPTRDPNKFPVCPSCKEVMDALFLSTGE